MPDESRCVEKKRHTGKGGKGKGEGGRRMHEPI